MPRTFARVGRALALFVAVGWVALGFGCGPTGTHPPPSNPLPSNPPPSKPPRPLFRVDFGAGAGVAFSPDGTTLAWGSKDGTVKVGRVADLGKPGSPGTFGVPDPQFSTHRAGPGPIRFSGDGTILVAGNFLEPVHLRDERRVGPDAIRVWDLATSQARFTVPLDGLGRRLAIIPDGKTLRASVRKGPATELVQSWDLATGKPSATLTLNVTGTIASAFTNDGSALALVHANGATITLFEAESGKVRATFPAPGSRKFVDLTFAPDDRTFAAVLADNVVEVRDASTGAVRASIAPPKDHAGNFAIQAAFSGDGRSLALVGAYPIPHRKGEVAYAGRAIRVDAASGVGVGTIEGWYVGCHDLTLGPDGRLLAITDTEFHGTVPEPTLTVWEFPPR